MFMKSGYRSFWSVPFLIQPSPTKKDQNKLNSFVYNIITKALYSQSGNVITYCTACNYLVAHSSLGVLLSVVGCSIPQVITWVR